LPISRPKVPSFCHSVRYPQGLARLWLGGGGTVSGIRFSTRIRRGSLAAGALIAAAAAPAQGQTTAIDCSRLSGAEEVECLRKALLQTQEALSRAERALQIIEPPRDAQPDASLGAEQAARRAGAGARSSEEGEQRVLTSILSSERVHPNLLQVHLENGQTWRQIQGD